MTITAVIAEYNPFITAMLISWQSQGADRGRLLVVIMSGDFVQRGAPAILRSARPCGAGASGGADLVLQLPCHFALGSAQHFARGAVSLYCAYCSRFSLLWQ